MESWKRGPWGLCQGVFGACGGWKSDHALLSRALGVWSLRLTTILVGVVTWVLCTRVMTETKNTGRPSSLRVAVDGLVQTKNRLFFNKAFRQNHYENYKPDGGGLTRLMLGLVSRSCAQHPKHVKRMSVFSESVVVHKTP